MKPRLIAALTILTATSALAQAPLGSVKTEGAEVNGLVSVSNGRATIGNNAAIIAGIQPSDVSLRRGGNVRVCAGSSVHVSQTTVAVARPPLLLALDRGAVEIHTNAEKTDSVLTPDLRFELSGAAPLDLRIRVVPNGDTCVDNAGKEAPVLHVTETFGDGAYLIRPGQRVLFEHGSLREVVDHESSSCGCPKVDALVLAGKGKLGDGKLAEASPFPEAVSQGLIKPDMPVPTPAGQEHVQVSSTLKYDGNTNTVSGPPGATTTATEAVAATPPPPHAAAPSPAATDLHVESSAPPPEGPHPLRALGRFFRKLFGAS